MYEQQLDEQQAASMDRMLTRRHQMRAATRAFIDAVKECRQFDVDEATIDMALHRDSRDRGETEGWAVMDSVYAAEARS